MSAQLTLDVLPEWRTRDGAWPDAAHQRGTVRLPWRCALGKPGDLVPAWVCCRCGGVETGSSLLEISHACCTSWIGRHGTCIRQMLAANQRDPQPGDWDSLWVPP
jgi:hypothetical protein